MTHRFFRFNALLLASFCVGAFALFFVVADVYAQTTITRVKVVRPNGGETILRGAHTTLEWSGGKTKVSIGVIGYDKPGTVLGWIITNAQLNSSVFWDGKTVYDAQMDTRWDIATLSRGPYYLLAVSEDSVGNMCFGAESDCNFDKSDGTFKILDPEGPGFTVSNITVTNVTASGATFRWEASDLSTCTLYVSPNENLSNDLGGYHGTLLQSTPTATGTTHLYQAQWTSLNPGTRYYAFLRCGEPDWNKDTPRAFTTITKEDFKVLAVTVDKVDAHGKAAEDVRSFGIIFNMPAKDITITIMKKSTSEVFYSEKIASSPVNLYASPGNWGEKKLEPNTTYKYSVDARAGVETAGTVAGGYFDEFTTGNFVSSSLTATITEMYNMTETGVAIGWQTSEPTTGQVDYNLDGNFSAFQTAQDQSTEKRTSHLVQLNGLKPGTTYYFRIDSWTSLPNSPSIPDKRVITAVKTFTTKASVVDPSTIDARIVGTTDTTVTMRVSGRYPFTRGGLFYDPTALAQKNNGFLGSVAQGVLENSNTFTITLIGLTPQTTYTYKPFVVVDDTTAYGNVSTFTTAAARVAVRVGDGTYELQSGEKVRLNNGATIEPVVRHEGVEPHDFNNMYFKVYDTNGALIRETADFVRVGGTKTFTVGQYNFTASVHSSGTMSKVTLTSASLSSQDLAPVSNVRVSEISTTSATFTWESNIPTEGWVTYRKASESGYKDENKKGHTELLQQHRVTITGLEPGTIYYYQVLSLIRGKNSTASSEQSFATQSIALPTETQPTVTPRPGKVIPPATQVTPDRQITMITENAKRLNNEQFDTILSELRELRNVVKEQQTELKYLRSLKEDVASLGQKVESAITNFVTYGVDENTKKLGEGERAAVLHSYKQAFDKLPETDADFADAIKIASGRFPSQKSVDAEAKARAHFKKIYKRDAINDNPNDIAAVTVMAYGLRQKAENRNLNSERTGIVTFSRIYGKAPTTTEEWNVMQAITYSGATRKPRDVDSDGDGLSDKREKELGTDSNNPDTDGDGYKDGEEVANGYNPLDAAPTE